MMRIALDGQASAAASISSSAPVPITTATSSRRKISGAMSDAVAVRGARVRVDHRDERHAGVLSVRWLRRSRSSGSAFGRPTQTRRPASPRAL